MIGACPEGIESRTLERWLLDAPDYQSVIVRIGKSFELGGHKAAAIGMVLEHASIDLVSEMDPHGGATLPIAP